MNKVNNIIRNIYRIAVSLVSIIALSVILFICTISTCYKTVDSNEITFFCEDSILKNIIVILLFLLMLFIAKKFSLFNKIEKYIENDNNFDKVKKTLLLVIFAMSCAWVLFSQYIPGSDQLDIINCAHKLSIKEYDMLEPGGYLNKCTNQIGLTLIEYYLAKVIGNYNIVVLQLLNAAGLTLLYKKIIDVLETGKASRIIQVFTLITCGLFLPMTMYTSFVYGTIWHVALALIAFNRVQKYIERYKWQDILMASLSISLAMMIKSNALIFLIAIVIFVLVKLFSDKEYYWKKMIIAACMIIFVIGTAKLPVWIIEQQTGYKLNQGESSYAYMAMGLQESKFAPGWWNGYNNQSYEASGYNTDKHTKIAKKEIEERLTGFKVNKGHAVNFFSKKIASMWSEPTFEGFWINQIRYHRALLPQWFENLMSMDGYLFWASILDCVQVLIYFGAVLWLLFAPKEGFIDNSFFFLTFCGGFLFHLIWEAKTQYSVTYVALLLPCAVMGYELFLNATHSMLVEKKTKKLNINYLNIMICVFAIMAFALIYKKYAYGCLVENTESYIGYTETTGGFNTDESVLEINHMKINLKDNEGLIKYLEEKLDENNISY